LTAIPSASASHFQHRSTLTTRSQVGRLELDF